MRRLYAEAGLPAHGDSVATEVAQPAIVTASLAGLRMLEQLGVTASAVVGHSLGELTALHWAGVFDEAALLRIARARGRAMADLGSPTGAMAAIAARADRVQPLLDDRVAIVGYNSPCQTVVAGEASAVVAVIERAQARGMRAVKLAVSHAFHTPLVAAAAPELERHLAHESFAPAEGAVFSTVTGDRLSHSEDLRRLLIHQVTSPVRFIEAVAVADAKVDCWVEVGPGEVLSGLAADCGAKPAFALDASGASLRPFLQTVGALFVLGATMDTAALFTGRFTRPFELEWRPKFFVNPCELAPLPDGSSLSPSDGERAGVRGDRPRQAHGSPLTPALSPSEGEREKISPLELVRQLVAERAELPAAAIKDDSRLLGDLHLNSISVGQLVAEAARRLGLAPLVGLNEFANATVARVATALEELVRTGGLRAAAEKPRAPAGVDSWIRSFTIDWIEKPLLARHPGRGSGAWEIIAPTGHLLAEALHEQLAAAGGRGVVVCLPPVPDEAEIPRLLEAARKVMAGQGASRLVVVQHGWGGGGFARTLHLEMPDAVVCVVNVPLDDARSAAWVHDEAVAGTGFVEASYDSNGVRREPRLRLLDEGANSSGRARLLPSRDQPESFDSAGASPYLSADDVLLVTGGGKGIVAECALALGRRTGVRLALLGRAKPEADAELASNLERFSAAGLRCRYYAADVTDADAVRSAIEQAGRELGHITAVLHGAGTNIPQLLSSLDEAAILRTLAPKTQGLRNVLAAVQADRLRALVTFGSIIGRAGLPGEADYALANEWQTALTEQFQAAHPQCRCLALEWSVWSGVGMGQRLGRIETLMQHGITPIPPDEGVEILCRLLQSPRSRRREEADDVFGSANPIDPERRAPARRDPEGRKTRAEQGLGAPGPVAMPGPGVAVVVTGRFGDLPTLSVEKPELPFLRFLEQVRVFFPGVELVADATLSAESDPYLEDHVYHGERLLPAVMGLEAMAQAAMAVTGIPTPPSFENVELSRPIVVPRNGKLAIRLAALVREPGVVEVVLRTEETGFSADHFKAVCRFAVATDEDTVRRTAEEVPGLAASRLPMDAERDVYDELLFHTGRFRRVRGYRHLRAKECLAEIEPDGDVQWFGRYLPAGLVLGDAGARDAGIHCIQACIPHARLLPIGVERIELGGAPCLARARERMAVAEGTPMLLLHARERRREQDTFTYDLELLSCDGCVLERWVGLRLRTVEPMKRGGAWPGTLLGPYLERRVGELISGADVSIAVDSEAGQASRLPGERASASSEFPSASSTEGRRDARPTLTVGIDATMRAALDSPWPIRRRPDGKPEAAGGRAVSASHAGRLTLAVAGRWPLGCDIEPVAARTVAVWQDLLGTERFCLAGLLAAEAGEDFDTAATRVWAAIECLKKAGAMVDAPLVLDASKPDGWVVLSSGQWSIATCVPRVQGGDSERLAVAVLAESVG